MFWRKKALQGTGRKKALQGTGDTTANRLTINTQNEYTVVKTVKF